MLQLLIDLPEESATQALAERLAASPLLANACFTLSGDLGSGKTTLVRHLLRALGVQGRIKSPTYALMESYEVCLADGVVANAYHFDLYRVQSWEEWENSGFRDTLASEGLKLVEWPERVTALNRNGSSADILSIDVAIEMIASEVGEQVRRVRLQAISTRGNSILQALK